MQDDQAVQKDDSKGQSATMSEKIREQIQKDQELAAKLQPTMDEFTETAQKAKGAFQGLTTALVPDAALVKRKRNARSVKRVAKARAKRKASRRSSR